MTLDTTGRRCLRLGPSGCRLSRTLRTRWPKLLTCCWSPCKPHSGTCSCASRTPGSGVRNVTRAAPALQPESASQPWLIPPPGMGAEGGGLLGDKGPAEPARPTGSTRPAGPPRAGGGSHVTWAKSTEATRPSCRVFWMWSQERLRLSQGDISLRTAAQSSWSCSGQVGEQRVVCSSAMQGLSSLGGGGVSPARAGPGSAPPPRPAMPQGRVCSPPVVFRGRDDEEEPPQGVRGVGTPVLLLQ